MELENNVDQPVKESTGIDNQPATWTYEVNGKNMTPEEIINSYNSLQGEFTKKSQKLSEYEKQGSELDEVKQKADQAEKAERIRAEEEVFNTFKTTFGSLSETQLKAIRDLQSIDNTKSFEDIAKSYWMINEAQLAKSKNNRTVMWNNIWVKWNEKQEVTISEKARKIHNLKTPEQRAEILSNMNL